MRIVLRSALSLLACCLLASGFSATADAQTNSKKDGFKEVYTGTIVSTSGRMVSTGFTLSIKDFTPDEDVVRYLGVLAEGGQDDLLKVIRNVDLGRFSPTGQVGRRINAVRKTQLPDGRTRIVVAFERWLRFAEVRNGYRSEDYPFGVLEFFIDAKGKGSGTYIAAGQVEMKRDKKTGKFQVELENFGTYPHRVMGVRLREKAD